MISGGERQGISAEVLQTYLHTSDEGVHRLQFMVEGVHCAACMGRIERAMNEVKGVEEARLNLSTKRLTLHWKGAMAVAEKAMAAAAKAGYGLTPYQPESLNAPVKEEAFLLRCVGVAGFASMNVMLFSVSLWSGAEGNLTQKLFLQWVSALITLPSIAYAGQPYFQAAIKALRHGRMSMEVPISIALILTSAISLFDTLIGEGETYYESAVMLLFFLLTGRYLEARVRGRSRNAAEHLLGLQHTFVAVMGKGGEVTLTPSAKVTVGSMVLWRQGERLGVDGVVMRGVGSVDTSVLTGESLPRAVKVGESVQAGMVNRGETLEVRTTATGQDTVLAEISRLVDSATVVKNRYTRLADRVSRAYAPVVHAMAILTFCVSVYLHVGWHESLLRGAAVLIVTCPCALALAVPTVQVAIMGRLLRQGIILKSGAALEKLAAVTAVVLDKTGTLTTGHPVLVGGGTTVQRRLAASMAIHSQHPLSVALAHHGEVVKPLAGVEVVPGKGLQATVKGKRVRLGSATFCGVKKAPEDALGRPTTWFVVEGELPVQFVFEDTLRPDAEKALGMLGKMGLKVRMLSGDTQDAVARMAERLKMEIAEGAATPQRKQALLAELAEQGEQVMMVGDGLNDAPSLALAPVGVSFGKASDLAKLSADVILQQEHLTALPYLVTLARKAKGAVAANIVVSLAYNVVTIPLAMTGYITPLLAALAMSASSVMVVANAARLGHGAGVER